MEIKKIRYQRLNLRSLVLVGGIVSLLSGIQMYFHKLPESATESFQETGLIAEEFPVRDWGIIMIVIGIIVIVLGAIFLYVSYKRLIVDFEKEENVSDSISQTKGA